MTWIRKHWEPEYIENAERTIKATVCVSIDVRRSDINELYSFEHIVLVEELLLLFSLLWLQIC